MKGYLKALKDFDPIEIWEKTTFCFDLLVIPCFKSGDYLLSYWLLDPSHAVTCGQNSRIVALDASKQVFLNQRVMIC